MKSIHTSVVQPERNKLWAMRNEYLRLVSLTTLLALFGLSASTGAAAQVSEMPDTGTTSEVESEAPASITVQDKFGGQIFGYDVDQNGTEGLLSEAKYLADGSLRIATETFDQTTGKIINVIATQTNNTESDWITWGIVGNHVGLDEFQQNPKKPYRSEYVVNPLGSKKFTGRWKPPIKNGYLLWAVSETQGTPVIAAYQAQAGVIPYVFSANVADNTFGPQIALTDSNIGQYPALAYNTKTNQAVLGYAGLNPYSAPTVSLMNLTNGKVVKFIGLGVGYINGIAVDPATGMACTTTAIDSTVQFYNLAKQTGVLVHFPGDVGRFQAGADVQVDSIHKLFLVSQPSSSTGGGSTVYVYNEKGKSIESIQGLNFKTNVHIGLNPSKRTGFVGPSGDLSTIQSFRY
jgi:hypothetical protein